MAIKTFSDGEAILFGWKTMKSNLLFFIGVLAVAALISAVPDIVNNLMKGRLRVLTIIIGLIFWVLQLLVGMGLIKIALQFSGNEKPKFAVLFSCLPLFFKYLLGTILYSLIVIGGLILLVVPGAIWAIKFQFVPYLIIDRGMSPVEALKKSAEITKGVKWELLAFGILLTVINLIGTMCLVIGLFATIPTTMVAYAWVYRKLLAQTETAQPANV